jgi:hypothetical protein
VTGAMRLAGVKKKSISDFVNYMVAHSPRHGKQSGNMAGAVGNGDYAAR